MKHKEGEQPLTFIGTYQLKGEVALPCQTRLISLCHCVCAARAREPRVHRLIPLLHTNCQDGGTLTPGSVFCSCSAFWALRADSRAQYVRKAHPEDGDKWQKISEL